MSDMARADKGSTAALDEALRSIRERAQSLRFGTIVLTVHDGRLTQLEVTEKRRFA